ncbi:MAG: D-2-hydroxyacid dehydrogenase family protein, partial [Burkholderiales bacterium]
MRVAILDDYQDCIRTLDAYKLLAGHEVTVFNDPAGDETSLARRLAPFEAIVLIRERTPFPASLIAKLPNLKLLSQTGKNAPHIDYAECSKRGIVVSAGGGGGHSTSELTWAMILGALRHIPDEVAALRAGRWQTTLGRAVAGRTLGVLGYGRLGSDVARIGKAFRMNVLVWGREGSRERAARDGFEIAPSKDALFERADVLSVHVLLRAESRGLVTRADFARMKPDALFVNTSRAGLIERGALFEALKAGRPGSAAIDVFD